MDLDEAIEILEITKEMLDQEAEQAFDLVLDTLRTRSEQLEEAKKLHEAYQQTDLKH